MIKTSQNDNLNSIHFLKHFYEYHSEKLMYKDMRHFIFFAFNAFCYYCFCINIQSHVELESVILGTVPYFEHTASLTYFLCLHAPLRRRKFWCARAWSRLHCRLRGDYILHNPLFKECQDFYRMRFIWVFPGFEELNKISKNWIKFLYLKSGTILWNQISLLLFLNQTRYRHEKLLPFGLLIVLWYFVSISTSV